MKSFLKRFRKDEDGAVTADWVVLTGGIIGLGIMVASVVGNATTPTADNLGNFLKDQSVGL